MLHGLGDCTPEQNCGCIGAGDGRRPPSQAVIEAVELALRRQDLIDGRCGCEDPRCGVNARLSEDVYVVAKAAMDAALADAEADTSGREE